MKNGNTLLRKLCTFFVFCGIMMQVSHQFSLHKKVSEALTFFARLHCAQLNHYDIIDENRDLEGI